MVRLSFWCVSFLGALCAATLISPSEPALMPPPPTDGSPLECLWPEVSGERLLERRVDILSVNGVDVGVAIAELSSKCNLPLSFIQASPEAKVSLDLRGTTVRQALDAIVAQAPLYSYGIFAGRLVLYPTDPKWQTRLDDLRLGPAPRVQVTRALANELSRRLPSFGNLAGPWVLGDPTAYTYQDVVTVSGPGSVLDLLVQLLGNRHSTFVLVVKKDGWLGPSLSVSSRDQLQSVKLAAPITTLRRRNETAQLKFSGTFVYGGSSKDLTAGACGTVYEPSDGRILAVSPDGLVTARGSGEAQVKASNEHFSDWVTIRVELPKEKSPPSPLAGVFLLPLPSCEVAHHEETAVARAEAIPSCLDSGAGPSFLDERFTAIFEGVQLPQVILYLNANTGNPVSFIDGPSPVPLELDVQDETIRSFLGRLLGQAPGYRCAVIDNHVVIYYDEPALHKSVEHVSIVQQFRGPASRAYVKHLSRQVEELKDLGVLLGGVGINDSPVYDEKVTLARKATVLEHLGQLLGKNPDIVFSIRYASTGSRYLNFGTPLRRRAELPREKPSPPSAGVLP